MDSNKVAFGWAFDADSGINDAASNGSPSAPLGFYTAVRAVAVNTTTGQRFVGTWQIAQNARPDLVPTGAAPDPYHGFAIDLKTQGFPAGTYTITIEGGEFPVGMGATPLTGSFVVTL